MKQISVIILLLSLFSSLTFAQTKLSAEILKKIEDNTPKALLQTPVVPKLKSDAEDENLKGKVKNLIEEEEDPSKTSTFQGRNLATMEEFNEKGNYVRIVHFSRRDGSPYEIKVYGYIDGTRVSDVEDLRDYSDAIIQTNPQNDTVKPDPRYNYKYEYKYADGKLVEMQIFFSSGRKGNRFVYNHNGNRREKLIYTENGNLNQKYVTVYNQKGYEIEWTDIAVINLPRADRKYFIKNETFDKQGNWTKRTFSKVEIENGKEVLKPAWIEYRTITYY